MRLTADRRLELMGRIIAIAEDRAPSRWDNGVSLQELAEALRADYPDIDVEMLRACVEPMRWVDMVGEDGTVVNLVDQVEVTGDDRVIVHDGWWRRLAVPTPAQAARLYVQAAAAAAQGGPMAEELGLAMRALRRLVGPIAAREEAPPPLAVRLLECAAACRSVSLNLEAPDRTIVGSDAVFDPLAVFREGDEWQVTLRSELGNRHLAVRPGEVFQLPLSRIFSLMPTGRTFEPVAPEDLPAGLTVAGRALEVSLEVPKASRWLLDPFEVLSWDHLPGERFRVRVRLWGETDLKTLLLRLGPDGRLVEPADLAGLQARTAAEVLALYE